MRDCLCSVCTAPSATVSWSDTGAPGLVKTRNIWSRINHLLYLPRVYQNQMRDLAKNRMGIKNRKCRMMLWFLKEKKNQMRWYKYTTASADVRCSKFQVRSIKGSVIMGKAVSKETRYSARWSNLPQIMQPPRSSAQWRSNEINIFMCVVLGFF